MFHTINSLRYHVHISVYKMTRLGSIYGVIVYVLAVYPSLVEGGVIGASWQPTVFPFLLARNSRTTRASCLVTNADNMRTSHTLLSSFYFVIASGGICKNILSYHFAVASTVFSRYRGNYMCLGKRRSADSNFSPSCYRPLDLSHWRNSTLQSVLINYDFQT